LKSLNWCKSFYAVVPGVDSLGDLGMQGVSSQMKRLYPHLKKFLSFLPAVGCLLGSAINLPAPIWTPLLPPSWIKPSKENCETAFS
jgi:hypothetical protein